MAPNKSKVFFYFLILSIFAVSAFSIYILKPVVTGDAPSYLEAMEVMRGGDAPTNFVPNRILTSSLGIASVNLFSKLFGSVEVGWLAIDVVLLLIFCTVFYLLVREIFESELTAFLAALFILTNYGTVSFALDYGMDIGGWAFYALSLLLTLKYSKSGKRSMLLYSAVAIGIGGLFKEYALLGVVPIAVMLAYENWPSVLATIKKGLVPAGIVLLPISVVYAIVFVKFNYTYVDWITYGNASYAYVSKTTEYIKSFGSLYNFLSFVVLAGVYCFVRYRNELVSSPKIQFFVASVALSALPVFIWPAITQRILFVTVPAAILVASFAIKKYEKYWIVFAVLIAICLVTSLAMDSYILPTVDIGPLLGVL